MPSKTRTLRDVGTGAVAIQIQGDMVQITIRASELRKDLEQTYTAFSPCVATVDDDKWDPVLGKHVLLSGGIQICPDPDRIAHFDEDPDPLALVDPRAVKLPFIVDDPLYPPGLRILIGYAELRNKFQLLQGKKGPRHKTKFKADGHDQLFSKWWQAKAKEKAIKWDK
jgi:hypothetical protein